MTGWYATGSALARRWLSTRQGGAGAALACAVLPACAVIAARADAWWLATLLAGAAGLGPWCPQIVRRLRAKAKPGAHAALARAQAAGGDAVCIWLRLADRATGGAPDADLVAARVDRITGVLRAGDHLERRGTADVVIVLAPGSAPDLEDTVQLAARLQGVASAPDPGVRHEATRLVVTVGLCRASDLGAATSVDAAGGGAPQRAEGSVTPASILDAAAVALDDALSEGAGTIRVFAACLRARHSRRAALASDAAGALDDGGFTAWFQPQVCTDTGRVSGFEALARWEHPDHGLVPPADFLPVLEAAGLLERLGNVMLEDAMRALVAWDRAGLDVPSVGVNMAQADLRDPHLAQRIAWMLDRHDLHANRLTIEVLESAIAEGGDGSGDSPVLRNVTALAGMGCRVDLDDFGTGHASITSLHRLALARVKIDRSFVSGIDRDRGKQKMIMTILSMCDHLGLQTLAEGVETPAEHAMLAQLGCNHVQGFGIARPMPFDLCCDWLRARNVEMDAAMRPIRRHP